MFCLCLRFQLQIFVLLASTVHAYTNLRLDRVDKKKNEYSSEFENVMFQLQIKNQKVNFVTSYKPPHTDHTDYLDHLEDLLFLNDSNEPLFIDGDLNMNLNYKNGAELRNFLVENDLKNCLITANTRIKQVFSKNLKKSKNRNFRTSKTLIEVKIHNPVKIGNTAIFSCQFSDHNLIASIELLVAKIESATSFGRNMCEENLKKNGSVDNKWHT